VSSHNESVRDITALIFDLGGVLIDWNPRHLYRKLFGDEAQMERFLDEICTSSWHDQHDRGVSTEASCAELAALYPLWADYIRAWGERSEEMVAGVIQTSVDVLRDVKATGMPCYALTNMEAETYPLRFQRFEFLHWFDGTVVSGFEGMAKPDSEIYRRLLERYSLEASHTLLIDDRSENLAPAAQLGLHTLLFESPEQLRHELESLSVLPTRV
jgi:2-haloacid dehalogenase